GSRIGTTGTQGLDHRAQERRVVGQISHRHFWFFLWRRDDRILDSFSLPAQGNSATEWLIRHPPATAGPMPTAVKPRKLCRHRNQGEPPMRTDWQELPRAPA